MSSIPSILLFAVRGAAVFVLATSSLSPVFAAEPECDSRSSNSASLPAAGSSEAWRMAKFPWLYLPKAEGATVPTRFPEPGSAEAVKFYKTPYLMDRPAVTASADPGKRWPALGSADAVMFYKTPYLMNRRLVADPSCP